MTDKTKLEARFHSRMLNIYELTKPQLDQPAKRFLQSVRMRGGLDTARSLLDKPRVSPTFERLKERGRLDLAVESLVLEPEFESLFSPDELGKARARLSDSG